MKRGAVALGVAVFSAATAPKVCAQVTADAMLAGRQPRTMDIRAAGRVDYDTNVARTNPSSPSFGSVEPEDVIYRPSIRADIVQPLGKQALFLSGDLSYIFHQNNPDLDHTRADLTGGVGMNLGPCGATAGGHYSRGRSELEDRTLVTIRNILEVKSALASVTCARPSGLGIQVSGNYSEGRNSAATVKDSDYNRADATVGLVYSRGNRGSISLIGSYGRTEYQNRTSIANASGGFELYSGGIRVERRLSSRLQGSVTYSYAHVAILDPSPVLPISEYSGPTYAGDITFRPSSRLRLSGLFSRAIEPSLVTSGGYEVATTYDLSANYQLGSRISFELGGAHDTIRTKGAELTGLLFARDAKTDVIRGSIRYKQSEHLYFTLRAERTQRDADNSELDYTSKRVGIGADFTF